jgi:dCTP deaminase
MMLSGLRIAEELGKRIVIEPMGKLNPNSVNLTLAPKLIVYDLGYNRVLDCRKSCPTYEFEIPDEGCVLQPWQLYLGSTVEYTETHPPYVPAIEGRSSLGRLGLSVHTTAGFGDCGFKGHWTLELSVVHPLRVYAGMDVCQIHYFQCTEPVEEYRGRYQNQVGAVASKEHHAH